MPRYYLDLIDENGTRVRIPVSPEQLAMLKVGDNGYVAYVPGEPYNVAVADDGTITEIHDPGF